MGAGLVVATDHPEAVVAAARDHDCLLVRWPDDGPRLIERHWDSIAPCLDALTEQTGVRRLSPDEAVALPGVSTIAVMLTLLGAGDRAPRLLVADPGAVTDLIRTISNLTYSQRRVLPMPLDILASMNRKLRGVAALGSALSVSGATLTQLRTRGRWAAVVDADGNRGRRAARHLTLAGIALRPATGTIDAALAGAQAPPADPWFEVARYGDDLELFVPAPGLDRESTRLSRAGDDLLVTVDGIAHPIELPSGLKRCVVVGGTVRDDGLRVRFRPERGKWRDG